MKRVTATAEFIATALISGIALLLYDGAVVGSARFGSAKLLVYSLLTGALTFVVPATAVYLIVFATNRLIPADRRSARPHRIALSISIMIAALLHYGGWYAAQAIEVPQG